VPCGEVACRRPRVGPMAAPRVWAAGVIASGVGGGGVPLMTPTGGGLRIRAVVSVSEWLCRGGTGLTFRVGGVRVLFL